MELQIGQSGTSERVHDERCELPPGDDGFNRSTESSSRKHRPSV